METARLPSGTALTLFDELDSTSAEVKRRIEAGRPEPGWTMARRQTAGYGRRGRAWSQNNGDLAATLLMAMGEGLAANPAAAGFALSLAIAAVLEQAGIAPREVALKWPNDVLLNGGKVSGILLERYEAAGALWLSAGVGLNIATRPDIPDYPTACLADALAALPQPEDLLAALDSHFQDWIARLEAEGFAPLREAWLARAGGIGAQITVRLPKETLHGVFEGLDADGTLLLRQGEVMRPISTGDVFFGAVYASNAG